MALDVRGDVVVAGLSSSERSNDYYIAKYAGGDGALLWEQRSSAPPDTFPPQAMALDTAGNVVLTGTDTNRNYQILKFSTTNGALLWETRGPRGSPRASMVDPSGNVTVIGSVLGSNGTTTAYAAKYNGVDGTLLWERREVEFDALVVNAQGNVVVAGSRQSHYSTTTYATADGSLLWQRGGPEGAAEAIALDNSGDIVVTGESADGTNFNFYTAKYAAADGALKWERRYNEPRNHWDSHTALAIDNKGDVVVTGTAGKVTTNFLSEIFYVAKYAAADGALLWEKRGPSGVSRAIAVDQAGDVLTTGYSWNGSSYDFYTAKTSGRDGTLVWESRYNNLANGDEYPLSVGIDTNDNVVVTGSTVWGQYTAKFAAADGTTAVGTACSAWRKS
jgi:hypothetical protein